MQQSYAKAKRFNQTTRFDAVQDVALDELFVGRKPVLGGVELDWSVVFALELTDQREGDRWAITLWDAEKQGAPLRLVLSDAGDGIGSGINVSQLAITQRGDNFHAIKLVTQVQWQLEKRAYKELHAEQEQEKKVRQHHKGSQSRKLAQKLRYVRQRCEDAVVLFDQYEFWAEMACDALEFVALEDGRWRTSQSSLSQLNAAIAELKTLDGEWVRPVVRYLGNQGPGRVAYVDDLVSELENLAVDAGSELVRELARLWRVEKELAKANQRSLPPKGTGTVLGRCQYPGRKPVPDRLASGQSESVRGH